MVTVNKFETLSC